MRQKKWIGGVLLTLLAALTLAGCSQEDPNAKTGTEPGRQTVMPGTDSSGTSKTPTSTPTNNTGGKKKIVFVFKIGGISYSEACKAGAQQANDDSALNVNVEYQASTEGTAEKQADIVEQAVANKADAIVVSPVDANAIIPSLDKAEAAGIKVFTWDADAPKSKRLFYVAAVDDVQIGTDIAEALVKDMGGKGKVLLMSGQRTAENLNLHLKGIQDGLTKHNITQITPVVYNDDDNTKATSLAVQALQAHPDITGIACTNSVSPKAAGEALRKLNLVGKVKVWGLGLPSETKAYLLDGSVSGLYLWDPQKLTYDTAKLVKNALDGKMPEDGQEIGPEGKIMVKNGIVTLPLRLEINKGNVESLKF
ncbi:MAG TPA: autoinducer 2 ABC transporter substrate-binding protein [Chthonomonadaceae bacterium]|nr:autoinducer 2 ABC transporter substrate-binding protein [Chthonomonadaceae bacterium]